MCPGEREESEEHDVVMPYFPSRSGTVRAAGARSAPGPSVRPQGLLGYEEVRKLARLSDQDISH